MKKVIGISVITIVFAFGLVCFAGAHTSKAEEQTTTKVPETTTHKNNQQRKLHLALQS